MVRVIQRSTPFTATAAASAYRIFRGAEISKLPGQFFSTPTLYLPTVNENTRLYLEVNLYSIAVKIILNTNYSNSTLEY